MPVEIEVYKAIERLEEKEKVNAMFVKSIVEQVEYMETYGLTATSQLDNRGGVKNGRYRGTDKWRYMNPKEERMAEIEKAELDKYNYNKNMPKDENKNT